MMEPTTITDTATTKPTDIEALFKTQLQKSAVLRSLPVAARMRALQNLKRWVDSNQERIIEAIRKDYKKPIPEVLLSEIMIVSGEAGHAIKHLSGWAAPKKVNPTLTMLGTQAKIIYEPKGVCLIIAPWNFPFNLAVGPLVSAIAAGNTAIIKPSEMTPYTSALIKAMVEEIFEPNWVSVVEGGVDMTTELLKLPFDHIFFTGSPRVGKIVMEAAAKNLSSVTLELGGKSPVVVTSNAHIKDTVEKITWGKWLNNGQTCIAPDYILVDERIKDKFISALQDQIKKQYGNSEGLSGNEDYGRLVNSGHFERINKLLQDAVEKNVEVIYGGDKDANSNFFGPTIVVDAGEDTAVMQEEIFGPILPIKTFKQIGEAIDYINQKPKPLALYVFSRTTSDWKEIMEKTSSGTFVVNDVVVQFTHNNLPFGGVNNSGIGKAHGWYGFETFSNTRSFLKQRIGLTSIKSFYPPYTSLTKNLMKWVKSLLY